MWNRRSEGGEPGILLGETRRARCSNSHESDFKQIDNQPNSLFSRTSSLSDHWQAQSPLMRESRNLRRPVCREIFPSASAIATRSGREKLRITAAKNAPAPPPAVAPRDPTKSAQSKYLACSPPGAE